MSTKLIEGKKKHINISKFARLSRDWVGGKNLFMCFLRVIPYGGRKLINKIPPKIPGQSREHFVYVFFLYLFFSLPNCNRYRPKGVLGKGVGNNKNESEMRQKCIKNASKMRQNVSCFLGKRGTFRNASEMRQKCAENLWGRTPFGRYRIKIPKRGYF